MTDLDAPPVVSQQIETRTIPVGVAQLWRARDAAEVRLMEDPKLGARVLLALRDPEQGARQARSLLLDDLSRVLVEDISQSMAVRLLALDLADWILQNEGDPWTHRGPHATISLVPALHDLS